MVDLRRLDLGHHPAELAGDVQVGLVQHELLAHSGKVRQLARQRPAQRPVHLGTLSAEEFGEIGPVLPGDARDQNPS